MKKITISVVVVLVVCGVSFFLFRQKALGAIAVKVMPAAAGSISSSIKATGKVVSAQEAGISASSPAQIVSVAVREGQRVGRGTVLALLDGREVNERIAKAKASLADIQGKVEQLSKNLEGSRKVFEVGGVSRQSLRDADTELNTARSLEKQSQAELRAAVIALENLKIRAPFAGIITRKDINPGEWATPGVPLFRLVDPAQKEIEVMVDESDAGLLALGQKVEVSSDAFPGAVWKEKVQRIFPAIRKEGNANTINVRVSLNTPATGLRFDQQIDVKIQKSFRPATVKLPYDALISRGGRNFVAQVREGVVHLSPVVTGIEDTTYVEIVQGLKPYEEIILPEGKALKEGDRIKTVLRDARR